MAGGWEGTEKRTLACGSTPHSASPLARWWFPGPDSCYAHFYEAEDTPYVACLLLTPDRVFDGEQIREGWSVLVRGGA
jgi:hypothetical protein